MKKVIHKVKSAAVNLEVGLLQKRARRYGYAMAAEKLPEIHEMVVENFFNTNYKRNALLSYVISPFLGEVQNGHSNNRECYTIAEILSELGYNVDVIEWNNTTFSPEKKYDLIIDNHNNLERLQQCVTEDAKKVFHATNAHLLYQNWIEYGRYYELYLKKGIAITPPRLISPGNNAEFCDAISMFGNEFTSSTYGHHRSKVQHLPMSVTSVPEIITERNLASAKKRFVWLNSHGALLKGLDIAIDAFSKLPDLELYICGDLNRDGKFKDAIDSQLAQSPNIKVPGWVDIEGEDFRKIVSQSAWVLGTSFSEGGGGSTLNCMAKGLIPVISKMCSLTLPENTGFYLEENNVETLTALINNISKLPESHLQQMSSNAYNFVASNHTIENFRKKYKEFLMRLSNESLVYQN